MVMKWVPCYRKSIAWYKLSRMYHKSNEIIDWLIWENIFARCKYFDILEWIRLYCIQAIKDCHGNECNIWNRVTRRILVLEIKFVFRMRFGKNLLAKCFILNSIDWTNWFESRISHKNACEEKGNMFFVHILLDSQKIFEVIAFKLCVLLTYQKNCVYILQLTSYWF